MSERKCSKQGCGKPHKGLGWCQGHYDAWRKHGNPDWVPSAPAPDLPGERWLPVAGYEGLYEVSDLGRVRSMDRVVERKGGSSARQSVRGRILVQSVRGRIPARSPLAKGYLNVTLSRSGKIRSFTVHRLVASAFLGPLPPGMETRHGPAGIQDNSVANLSYGTPVENALDKVRDGTHVQGSMMPWAVLTEDIVRQCRKRFYARSDTIVGLAGEFGVAMQTMHDALTGRTWRHVEMPGAAGEAA